MEAYFINTIGTDLTISPKIFSYNIICSRCRRNALKIPVKIYVSFSVSFPVDLSLLLPSFLYPSTTCRYHYPLTYLKKDENGVTEISYNWNIAFHIKKRTVAYFSLLFLRSFKFFRFLFHFLLNHIWMEFMERHSSTNFVRHQVAKIKIMT